MVIGAHPAITMHPALRLPTGWTSWKLRVPFDDPVRLVKCETIDIEVPAEAEMVIAGEVLPEGMVEEVPSGKPPAHTRWKVRPRYSRLRRSPTEKPHVLRDAVRRAGRYPVHHRHPHRKSASQSPEEREGGLDLLDVRCLGISGLMAIVPKLRPRVEGQAKTALIRLSSPYLHPRSPSPMTISMRRTCARYSGR